MDELDQVGLTLESCTALLDLVRQAAFVKDVSGRFLHVNKAFCREVGRSRQEILGRVDEDVFPASMAKGYRADDARVIASMAPLEKVEENIDTDGEIRYVRVIKRPLFQDGVVKGVQGVFWDVTDEVRVREQAAALSLSQARFESFMGSASVVAWVKDRDLRLRYVNHAFEVLFQRSAEELIGCADEDFIPAEVAEAVQRNDRLVMAKGRALERVELVPGADGKLRHWLVTKFPFPGDAGETWIGGLAFEITDRVEVEEALRESESRLRLVAAASQDPIWDHDLVNNRMWRNQAYEHLFGNGRPGDWEWWEERVHPKDRQRVAVSLRSQLEQPHIHRWRETYHFRGLDGGYHYVQEHVSIDRNPDGKPVRLVGSMRDLTPIQRAQEEKDRVGEKLRETQKLESLGVLAGGIAHDFNNLLTSMLGNVNLTQLELAPKSPVQLYLADVEKAVIRAADLCKQMLAYSGRGSFVIRRLDVNELVEEMTNLLKVSISKQAVLKFSMGADLPMVSADPTQLRQVVMNLVVNASEAIGERSGLITVATGMVHADRDYLSGMYLAPDLPAGNYVFIEVSDTGCGMDAATKERIFEPFFTTKFTGRGLGLAAVLGIVRSHKGALRVYSEATKGSSFKFLLPPVESAGPDSEDEAALPPPVRFRGEGLVLVVDDEETVRATARRILESAGYSVKLAHDGREGVERFEANLNEVRLVLLDLTMPHLDGVETFREMRRLRPDVPVLLMSGYNEQEAVQRFTGRGLAGFVQKPFQLQVLLSQVAAVLGQDAA